MSENPEMPGDSSRGLDGGDETGAAGVPACVGEGGIGDHGRSKGGDKGHPVGGRYGDDRGVGGGLRLVGRCITFGAAKGLGSVH